jgi:hypothetical protein
MAAKKKNASREETALMKAVNEAVTPTGDVDQAEVVAIMEAEGVGPRALIKQIREMLRSDPGRLIQVDRNGVMRLRERLLPKHTIGAVEMSATRVKMVDKGQLMKLAVELARMLPKQSAKTEINDNRQVFVALPVTKSKEEAFADYIEADVVEPKQITDGAAG